MIKETYNFDVMIILQQTMDKDDPELDNNKLSRALIEL